MIWAIHGNLGHPDEWNECELSIAGDREWIRVNLWSEGVTDFAAWANRLNDQVEALDPEPFLVGYSLGGRLAMHALIAATPPLWNGAVFVSAIPGISDPSSTERRRQDLAWASMLRESSPVDFLREWNANGVLDGQPVSAHQTAVVEEYREQIAHAFETWSLGVQADLRQQLLACEVPQLWVVGAEDTKFRAIAEDAVEMIPHARLNVIEDCGHRVLLQRPRELAQCIREFIAESEI